MGQWVTILSAVAQAERRRILERTNEGRQEAKLKGIKFGPQAYRGQERVVLTLHQKALVQRKLLISSVLPRSTVYKILEDERASDVYFYRCLDSWIIPTCVAGLFKARHVLRALFQLTLHWQLDDPGTAQPSPYYPPDP